MDTPIVVGGTIDETKVKANGGGIDSGTAVTAVKRQWEKATII